MSDTKHLVLFTMPAEEQRTLRRIMDDIAAITQLPPPYVQLPPHVTFHKPISGISEELALDLVRGVALHTTPTRLSYEGHPFAFGKQYIVTRVHPTIELASMWGAINDVFRVLPEYEHGPYDRDNTLHITLAHKTNEVFDQAWNEIRSMTFPEGELRLGHVELWRRNPGESWERVKKLQLSRAAQAGAPQ